MNLLGEAAPIPEPVEEVKPAAPPPQEMDSDLQVLSNLLEEDYNLEKEADFFKSVLFDDLQSDKQSIDENVLKEKEGQIQELLDRLSNLKKEFDKFKQRITKEAETAKRFSNEASSRKYCRFSTTSSARSSTRTAPKRKRR
jgi:molecular chaperone GrpE (heat shock protein)